jgi:hypothetical protein
VTAPSDPHTGKRPIRLADRDGRPDILLGPNVHITTTEMVAALKADPLLYQRSKQLVHVVRSEQDDEVSPDTPVIRPCPVSYAIDRVSAHARCLRKVEDEWRHVSPPRDRVIAVLERGSWSGIRPLDGVIEAPTMRENGSILQYPGYDRSTRSLYEPNAKYHSVPDSPTQSDASLAYAHLADVFVDFPYVEESHRCAAVAAILTIVARSAIRGAVPCWLFDASTSRSGKSLQADVISLIATGRPAPRMTFPEDDEELEKVLSGFAIDGARVVNFDNVARAFGGAALDKCITATGKVQLRQLGGNVILTLPWLAVVLASGNNVWCRGDMLARVLSPRIESPLENPETRDDATYLRRDRAGEDAMCAWALEHRARLVVDALTLLRAYHIAGRPAQPVPRFGGFSAWRNLVASALVWAGAPDPLGARRGLGGDDDPQRIAEAALVAGWARLCAEHSVTSMTASGAISHLYPPPRRDEPPDAHDGLRESIQLLTGARPGFAPGTDRLGRALQKLKARPLGGQKLTIDGKTGGSIRWRATKT